MVIQFLYMKKLMQRGADISYAKTVQLF